MELIVSQRCEPKAVEVDELLLADSGAPVRFIRMAASKI
jgi:hypothetical protein